MDIKQLLFQGRSGGTAGTDPAAPPLRVGDRFPATVVSVDRGRDALLAFGQFKAYARLPLPVAAGQQIQISVEAADGGLRLIMASPGPAGKSGVSAGPLIIDPFEPVPDRSHHAAHLRSLAAGTVIEGRITGIEQEGRMLVDFGRFKAFTRIDIPVRQGQKLPLVVVAGDQGLSLRVATEALAGATGKTPAPPTPSSAAAAGERAALTQMSTPPTAAEMEILRGAVRQLRQDAAGLVRSAQGSDPAPIASAMASIDRLLSPAAVSGDLSTLIDKVKNFVETSGLYFEKNLETVLAQLRREFPSAPPEALYQHPTVRQLMTTDLKPNLLILQQFIEKMTAAQQAATSPEMERSMLDALKSVVQRTLSSIEQQQLAATDKPVDQTLFQAFSHLLHLADASQNARLKVYYAKKGKAGEAPKPPRVSLLLEMDRLGSVRSDLWMAGKDLNVTFFVRDAAVKADIESRHGQIRTALKDTFNTVVISVVVSEKKIEEFDGETLSPTAKRQLDISI